jgi:Zn-dependent protease with chaperone function
MLLQIPGGWAATVLISLTPAAVRWWWGRALSRLADDPVLPERLAAQNRRFSAVSAGCAALLFVGWPSSAIWSVPILIVGQAVGGFPLRKALYQETWSLGARLSFLGRLIVGVFGFWILLTATPWLVSRAGPFDWAAATGLALILALWNWYSDAILRALWRTQPITDPIAGRFEALASACGLPMPRFEYVPMRGGVLANAVAVPSLRRSSVIFTDTLLARLTGNEAAAICAHELAHLEYYNIARLRRVHAINYTLILGAAAAAPLTRLWSGSSDLGPIIWLWPSAVLIALVVRARHRQKNETISDLRAVALTGDPEALAGALATLHAVARVPRRWDQQRERASTHPSLARRIRDIRAAAGIAAATLTPSAGFRAVTGEAVVTFDGTHLIWQERVGTTHLLDYAALVELRLHASATGAITLVAVERHGRRWQMTPRAEDLPVIQTVLDVVDGRLAHDAQAPAISPAVARLVAILGWSLAVVAGQVAAGFVAVLAAISPGPLLLRSAGTAALAAAALSLRDGGLFGGPETAALLATVGAGLLALGWVRRAEPARGERPLFAVLAVCSALAVATIGFGGLSPIRLHQGARSASGAVVLLVALGAACWTWRNRRAFRRAAFAASLGAVAVASLGSASFLDYVVRDPFLMSAPPVTWTAMTGPAIADFEVPFAVQTLHLSPHATLAAFERMEDDDSNARPASPGFHIGRPGGRLSPVDAAAVAFVDDNRALLLVMRDGAAEVRDVSFDDGPVVNWCERLPDIRWGTLTYEARANQWIAVGHDPAGQLVRATGTVRHAGTEMTTWKAPTEGGGGIETIGTQGAAAFIVEKRYMFGALHRVFLGGIGPLLAPTYSESWLWRLRDGRRIEAGRSLLDASCVNDTLGDPRLVCTAFDGTRTRIVAIDIGSGSVTAVTTIDGHFRTGMGGTRGWLTGWGDSGPLALRLATREAIHPPVPASEYVSMMSATDAVMGTVAWQYGASRIRLYRTE